jgi:hypothetical protein
MKNMQTRIPFFRARLQKSGQTYFYFEIPGTKGREEIALGNNKQSAIKKWQSLLLQCRTENRSEPSDLLFSLELYREICVPLLSPLTQRENLTSIEKLVAFFKCQDYGWEDIESPELFEIYSQWRNPKFSLRIKGELSLLKRVRREHEKLRLQTQLSF